MSQNYGTLLRCSGDDGDASPGYVRKRGAGGEPLTRRLRQVMDDALPSQLPELAMPAPGAQLLAVVFLQLREAGFTHPALVVVLVHSGVVSPL